MSGTISIIVPVYNICNYLSSSLQSILNQTYQDIEVIAVDDGSTDGSYMFLQQLREQNKRLRVIHQDNQGVTAARLTGVKNASGEWIGFVDGDDIIEPHMFEKLIKNAEENACEISHCGYKLYDQSGVILHFGTGKKEVIDHRNGLKELLYGNRIEALLCNKLYRRELFDAILKDRNYNLSIRNNEDLLMNYYLFKRASKSVYEDFCPYHYIKRKGSASTSEVNIHMLSDPIKVLNIIYKDVSDDDELREIVEKRIYIQLILSSIQTTTQKDAIVVRNLIRRELKTRLFTIIHRNYHATFKAKAILASIAPDIYRILLNAHVFLHSAKRRITWKVE